MRSCGAEKLAAGVVFCCAVFGAALISACAAAAADVAFEFGPQPQGARAWLANEGFEVKMALGDPSQARVALGENGLIIETFGPAEPIVALSNIHVSQPARLSVTWGVNRYPAGANWDAGTNNEAIMVMVFFGTEKYPGGFFVPPVPYFIGFFLCDRGRRQMPLVGRSYQQQGRYVCVDGPPAGQQVTTTVALGEAFRTMFGRRAPPVSGFAIEADTTQVGQGARSSAWVKAIRISSEN